MAGCWLVVVAVQPPVQNGWSCPVQKSAIAAGDSGALEKGIKMTLAIHAAGALWWTVVVVATGIS